MAEHLIRDRLVARGWEVFRAPRQLVPFTGHPQADALLNDLENYPHAFVLACIMDRQIKAEKAWLIPYQISEKIGGFSFERLSALSENDVRRLMREPKPLHRFVEIMAKGFYSAVQRIKDVYEGDASRIWRNKPPSSVVIRRFLEFYGVGPKIAHMAANILARELKVEFADYTSIDISADVHIRRVFSRLGLCDSNPSETEVILTARGLYPEFPGIMDFACWEIGKKWCKPSQPECRLCYMQDICPTAQG